MCYRNSFTRRRDAAKYSRKRLILRRGDTTISLRKYKHQRNYVMFSNIKNRSYFSTVKKTFHYSLCFVEQQKEERYLHSGGGNKNLNFSHFIYLHINLLRMINHLFPFPIYPNNFVFILNFSLWETHFVHMNLIHNYDFIFWFFEINLSPPAIPIT